MNSEGPTCTMNCIGILHPLLPIDGEMYKEEDMSS